MAIKGITYSNQRVSAADHGSLFAKLFSDGVLTGCGMSHTLNTCTIASGAFIVAGRLTNIIGSETITFASGHSGYARIVGVIDLTQAAPVGGDGFAQFSFRVDYGATLETFNDPAYELIQDDINDRGTKYEVEWGVVPIDAEGVVQGEAIRYISSAESQSGGEPGTITGNSYKFVPSDPSITGEDAIIFRTDPGDSSNWEIAILVNGSFKFTVDPGTVDVFLVGGGRSGNTGGGSGTYDNPMTGGRGGAGGKVVTSTGCVLSKNTTYPIVIGSSNGDTIFGEEGSSTYIIATSAGGISGGKGGSVWYRADPAGADAQAPDKGTNGSKAFNGNGCLAFPNTFFGSSGGGAGVVSNAVDNNNSKFGKNGGATLDSETSTGCSTNGRGANYDGTNVSSGKDHTGQGGGGAGNNRGTSSAAGDGGSGIIIIRNHRQIVLSE